MLTRNGDIVEYTDCIEIVRGVFVCHADGSVYIHDDEGEVKYWTHDMFAANPGACVVAICDAVLAAKRGVGAVRRNITDRGVTLGELIKSTTLTNQKSHR